jgi:hypothetical protein
MPPAEGPCAHTRTFANEPCDEFSQQGKPYTRYARRGHQRRELYLKLAPIAARHRQTLLEQQANGVWDT